MKELLETLKWLNELGEEEIIASKPKNHLSRKKALKETENSLSSPHIPPLRPSSSLSTQPISALQAQAQKLASQAQTVEDLKQALLSFEGCPLKITATNTVFCDGFNQAQIMVIGEAPGADEDKQGKPFVGMSGQLLDKIFATIGLSRQTNLYISNIIPWRPPGNRQPTPNEIALCLPFIERHIELIAPKFLLLTGGTSTKAILRAKEGITQLRGKWHIYETLTTKSQIEALTIYHPAYLLRSPLKKREMWKDMLTLKQKLKAHSLIPL